MLVLLNVDRFLHAQKFNMFTFVVLSLSKITQRMMTKKITSVHKRKIDLAYIASKTYISPYFSSLVSLLFCTNTKTNFFLAASFPNKANLFFQTIEPAEPAFAC